MQPNLLTAINLFHIKLFVLALGVFFVIPALTMAQETDTTRKSIEMEERQELLRLKYRLDRSASEGMLSESGVHEVPEPTEYYTPPFKGQEYLDMAVEAYRKELEDRIGPDWMYQFFRAIAPFVNNRFEFGVYQIYDMPVVDRDNPLFQSNDSKEKID